MSDYQRVPPSADEIRSALERILASEAFANAGRLTRLLRYVVERSLAGEGDRIKEYVLGVEVFDRGEQYDPRLDSIVRVEARRLRAKLDEYYRNGGTEDAVLIEIPRGTYAPVFTVRGDAARAHGCAAQDAGTSRRMLLVLAATLVAALGTLSWLAYRSTWAAEPRTSLAVLPFEQHSGHPWDQRLAARLTDMVTSELARIGNLAVVSRTSVRQFEGTRTPLPTIAQTLGAELVLETTLQREADQLKVTARLVRASTDRKVWAEMFTASHADVDVLSQRIARAVDEAAADVR